LDIKHRISGIPLCKDDLFNRKEHEFPALAYGSPQTLDSLRDQISQRIRTCISVSRQGLFRKRFKSKSKSRLVSTACSALLITAAACLTSSSAFFLGSAHASISGESRLENRGFVAGFLTTS
jgi:hypothetical protein